MKATLLELIELRILETGNTEGSCEPFEIDGLTYDVDYKSTLTVIDGIFSNNYYLPSDKGVVEITITEVEIRDIWNAENESVQLGDINKQFYIL